jgi:hypothetical protein
MEVNSLVFTNVRKENEIERNSSVKMHKFTQSANTLLYNVNHETIEANEYPLMSKRAYELAHS